MRWKSLSAPVSVASNLISSAAAAAASSPTAAAAAGLHLPRPAAGKSPRKAGQCSAELAAFGWDGSQPGSHAAAAVSAPAEQAVEAQLAALAEPLPEAAAVEEAVAAEAAAAAAPARRLGGPLAAPAADQQGCVRLRVLIDGSAVEVFTGSGEVRPGVLFIGVGPGMQARCMQPPCMQRHANHLMLVAVCWCHGNCAHPFTPCPSPPAP